MKTNTRIAILADIHGNSLALDAVMQDIQTHGGVDTYWFLGDYVAIGHDPVGVLERIATLKNTTFIRGNTDRYVVEETMSYPSTEEMKTNLDLLPRHVRVARSFAWTAGAVAATGWLPWLRQLPLDVRTTLPDGTRVLLVHAAPGKDGGPGFHTNMSDQETETLASGCEADLLLVGHTHVVVDRTVKGVQVVNPGSLSNPQPPDWRASYAILTASEAGYEIELFRVAYDWEAAIQAAKDLNHPSWKFIQSILKRAMEHNG